MTTNSPPEPEAVVQRQTEAYNEGDIDGFISCYSEDALITEFDDNVVAKGHDEIYDQYNNLFETVPNLRCELVEEFTIGEYVACEERVIGLDGPVEALAVYLVENSKIHHLWLGRE